jgi:hypothetical protein
MGSLRKYEIRRAPAEHEQDTLEAVFARLYSSDCLSIAGGLALPAREHAHSNSKEEVQRYERP